MEKTSLCLSSNLQAKFLTERYFVPFVLVKFKIVHWLNFSLFLRLVCMDRINEISSEIIKAGIEVHRALGCGLLESAYQKCLASELRLNGLRVESEVELPVVYRDMRLEKAYRVDLLVERTVIVEIKSVAEVSTKHRMQLLTYLRLANKKLGLLINFGRPLLRDGIVRVIN